MKPWTKDSAREAQPTVMVLDEEGILCPCQTYRQGEDRDKVTLLYRAGWGRTWEATWEQVAQSLNTGEPIRA